MRLPKIPTVLAVVLLSVAAVAVAFWTSTGSGQKSSTLGTLTAPVLTVPPTSDGTTTLNWTAATVTGLPNAAVTYDVERRTGSAAYATVTSGPCASSPTPLSRDVTSCRDTVSSSGTYTYRVTARYRSYTAKSNEAGSDVRVLDHFGVTTAATTVAGTSQSVTVTAQDAANATVTAYTGRVSLSVTDPKASVPGDRTYTSTDRGVFTFTGLVLKTAGARAVQAQDTVRPSITGSASVLVTPAAATALAFRQQPSERVEPNVAFGRQPTVAVVDAYDNTVTSDSGGAVTLSITGGGSPQLSCNPTTNKSTPGSGLATFSGCAVDRESTVTLTASRSGLTPAVSQSVLVAKKLSQKVSFTTSTPSGVTVDEPPYTVRATSDSGLPVVISLDASSVGCRLTGSSSGATVDFTGVGTCRINADQPGNDTYLAANTQQQSVNIGKVSQKLFFDSSEPSNPTVGGAPYTVRFHPSSTSGPPVVLSLDGASKGCAISGSGSGATVTFTAVGACKLNINQAGDANHNAAPQVQQSFNVSKGSQSITFTSTPTPGALTYRPTATSSSGLAVAFTIDSKSTSGCFFLGATVVLVGAGSCIVDANQPGDANYLAAPQVQQTIQV